MADYRVLRDGEEVRYMSKTAFYNEYKFRFPEDLLGLTFIKVSKGKQVEVDFGEEIKKLHEQETKRREKFESTHKEIWIQNGATHLHKIKIWIKK